MSGKNSEEDDLQTLFREVAEILDREERKGPSVKKQAEAIKMFFRELLKAEAGPTEKRKG